MKYLNIFSKINDWLFPPITLTSGKNIQETITHADQVKKVVRNKVIVYLPKGPYIIPDTLTIPPNVTLEGSGKVL